SVQALKKCRASVDADQSDDVFVFFYRGEGTFIKLSVAALKQNGGDGGSFPDPFEFSQIQFVSFVYRADGDRSVGVDEAFVFEREKVDLLNFVVGPDLIETGADHVVGKVGRIAQLEG